MNEFSAAFQFPLYFGYNTEALIESLAEPDQEPIREPRVCVITEPDLVLAGEDSEQISIFLDCLRSARSRWQDTPPEHLDGVRTTFNIVAAPYADYESFRRSWESSGALISELLL